MDGLFDVLIIDDLSKLDLLRSLPRVYRGTHLTHPKVTIIYAITQVIIGIIGVLLLNEKLIYLLIYLSCIFFFYFVIRIKANLQ